MVLRELLSVFGLQFNDSGARAAEKAMDRLAGQAEKLAGFFSAGLMGAAVIAPFVGLAKLASNAQEDLNLLDVAFKENANSVVEWSDTAAKELGRSRFELRKFAANLGLVLSGMGATSDQSAKMATDLSELAVHFSSLSNFSEDEVLGAFRGGITGETESLKRMGIVMNETEVAAFALNRGITKSVKSMTSAEKAALRYEFIMEKAGIAQGDATKTALSYANAMRRVKALLIDLGTEAGLRFLPVAEGLVNGAADLLVSFRELAEGTNIFTAALIALGGVAVVALAPMILAALPLLAAFALLVLVIDEIITLLSGGTTVLGQFSDYLDAVDAGAITDLHPALEVVLWLINRVRDAIGALGVIIGTVFEGIVSGDFAEFQAAWSTLWDSLKNALSTAAGFWLNILKGFFVKALELVADLGRKISQTLANPFMALNKGAVFLGQQLLGGPQGQQAAAPATIPAGEVGAGRAVTVMTGGNKMDVQVSQQPGESSDSLVGRLVDKVNAMFDERDEAVLEAIEQRPE